MSIKEKAKQGGYWKYLKWFWGLTAGFLLSIVAFVYLVSLGVFGALPQIEELENPKQNLASEVLSADGKILGRFYKENRSNVKYRELSKSLVDALIATEDVRFREHPGIDGRRLFTIVLYNLVGKKQGASTITQQLAKNLFPRKRFDNFLVKVTTKVKEMIIALRIERRYTKEEILTMYLNTVQFGGNAYGIQSASKIYFGTTPDKLTVNESAMLVGMLKGISQFNPVKNPESALNRRNTVLNQMYKAEVISEPTFDSLRQQPIVLKYEEEDHNKGLAPYFREQLRLKLQEWADQNGYDLYKDGLKIYTTIDTRLQRYAEEAVAKHISKLQQDFYKHWKGREPWKEHPEVYENALKHSSRYVNLKNAGLKHEEILKSMAKPVAMRVFTWQGERDTLLSPIDSVKHYLWFLQAGMMSMDPKTGHIKAWVGGINHKYFKYDHVNMNARRQVGSTFKPFVYTMAIDNGYSPCTKVPNQPVTFEEYDNWTPKNADFKNGGEMTLYKGLGLSVNNIVAYVMKQLGPNGPQVVIDLARKLGIQSKLEAVPSICLGTMDISVTEMTGAFAAYANQGLWTEPTFLLKIEDKNGNIIQEYSPQTVEAMSPQTAYVMLTMLKRVVERGTAYKIRGQYGLTYPIGGKTGTTQENSDGWFLGITRDLATGVWVGNDSRAIHFRTLDLGGGSNMALPVFALYMQKAYADKELEISKDDFDKPEGPLKVEINCEEYEDPMEQGTAPNALEW